MNVFLYLVGLFILEFILFFQCLGPDRASPTVDGADSEAISCILCQEEVSNLYNCNLKKDLLTIF